MTQRAGSKYPAILNVQQLCWRILRTSRRIFITYLEFYIAAIASIWWITRVGWAAACKTTISVFIPSLLIIIFNAKFGRFLFENPILGMITIIPTAIFILKASQSFVVGINSWIDQKANDFFDSQDVVEAEVITKDDA